MQIAETVASRGTCDREYVGAVIVRDECILSTGYNGSIRGLPYCSEEGHMMEAGHCVRTVHAEAEAIIQAARKGVCLDGATIFVTANPCWNCFKLIANAGITRIVFAEFYRDDRILQVANQLGISITILGPRVDGGPGVLTDEDEIILPKCSCTYHRNHPAFKPGQPTEG